MEGSRIKNIEYSKKFLKSLQKLPRKIIKQAEEKEKIFKEDCFNPRLKTHKLKGKDKDCWAFWINDFYRIKFTPLENCYANLLLPSFLKK